MQARDSADRAAKTTYPRHRTDGGGVTADMAALSHRLRDAADVVRAAAGPRGARPAAVASGSLVSNVRR